jgi:hypothetical protein
MGKMMGVMSSEIRTLRSLYTFKYQIFFAPNTDQSSTDKGEPWVKPGKTLGQARKNPGSSPEKPWVKPGKTLGRILSSTRCLCK